MAEPIVGCYVSTREELESFISKVKTQEGVKTILQQIQTGSTEGSKFVVINRQTSGVETDGAITDTNRFKIGLTPLKIQYLKDKPLALSRLIAKLKDKGFICKFDLEADRVEIRSKQRAHKENEALEMIRENLEEIHVNLPPNQMTNIPNTLPVEGSGNVNSLVVMVDSKLKLVGMTDDMEQFKGILGAVAVKTENKLDVNLKPEESSLAEDNTVDILTSQPQMDVIGPLVNVDIEQKTVGMTEVNEAAHNLKTCTDKPLAHTSTPDGDAKVTDNPIAQGKNPAATDETTEITEQSARALEPCQKSEAVRESEHYKFSIKLGPQMDVKLIKQIAEEVGAKYKCEVTVTQNYGCRPRIKREASLQIPENPSLSISVYGLKEARVRTVVDSIEKQKAHVIVNTADTKLDLERGEGVSWCILQAAGPSIQNDLRNKYPDGIKYGDLAESGSGDMTTCKTIYHGALPYYPQDKRIQGYKEQQMKCLRLMVSLVLGCLTKAASEGYLTIALPTFGTGNLQYPAHLVVQHMYKAIKLFKEKEPSSSRLKEIIIVIHPETKLAVKQVFLTHRQTYKLKTLHVATLRQIREENQKDYEEDKHNMEIRVLVGTSILQVVYANISDACAAYVSDVILVLWSDEEIKKKENQELKCIDPDWKDFVYIQRLADSKCAVGSLRPGRTLIHCYYQKDSEKSLTEALIEGLKRSAKEGYNTITIPIAANGYMGAMFGKSAKIIKNAVVKAKTNIYVITVAIDTDGGFDLFAQQFDNNLLSPIDIDGTPIADEEWETNHAERASMANEEQQAGKTINDSVVVIESDSEKTTMKAAEEFRTKLKSRLPGLTEETS